MYTFYVQLKIIIAKCRVTILNCSSKIITFFLCNFKERQINCSQIALAEPRHTFQSQRSNKSVAFHGFIPY